MVLVVALVVVVVTVRVIVVVVGVIMVANDKFVGADGQSVGAGPFEGIFRLEELGVDFDGAVEVEAADVEDAVEGDVGVLSAMNFRDGVDRTDAGLEGREFGGGDEIGFVENYDVSEGELLHGFVVGTEVLKDVLSVYDGYDGIEAEVGLHLVVGEKRLRDRAGVSEAGGLDEDAVERLLTLHEAAEDADEVTAHGAADAAVVHLEELFIGLDNELVVHTDLAEFVFNHSDFFTVLLGENAIEERGFAGAKEAGENGDRNRHEKK